MKLSASQTDFFESVRRVLGAPPPALQTAALPWRETKNGVEVMLITSRGTGRWIIPKGWPEKGETLKKSAEREAREEAGIKGTATGKMLGSYYYDKDLGHGNVRRCEVRVFPMHVRLVQDKWPEMRERQRRWLKPAEAAELVGESDLAELISNFSGKPGKSAA